MVKPDYLQLHGDETPQRVAEIKQGFSLPVIKAFSIRNADDISACKPYEDIADRFLFDAKAPAGSQLPGGNGISFDWTLLSEVELALPWMLSGGLDADNILQALEVSRATKIDVSSGVESSPGVKDIEKITAFIKTVRDRDNRAALLASRQVGASA
jgi:phosphoribosylanthranilate isomerase